MTRAKPAQACRDQRPVIGIQRDQIGNGAHRHQIQQGQQFRFRACGT
jgi:hypothetical protein